MKPLTHTISMVIAFLTVLCSAGTVAAQNVAPDDPGLLLGYFSLHHALDQAAAKDPSLRHYAASMMGITDADFATVARIAESVIAAVQKISFAHPIDAAAAHHADTQRRAALTSALNAIHQQLSPTSWAALHGYINGAYRANARFRRAGVQ